MEDLPIKVESTYDCSLSASFVTPVALFLSVAWGMMLAALHSLCRHFPLRQLIRRGSRDNWVIGCGKRLA
jgi:hypothetical protein